MTKLDILLRALARLAIRRGWLYPALADRLRHAYLAAARAETDTTPTDSRLSVMTGLQRRDIARLRAADTPTPQRQPLAEIIAAWVDDPALPVTNLPLQGDTSSFATLARSVRKDVHPRTFLDLLIQAGAVETSDTHASLLTQTYVPQSGSDDQLAYLADNVADHLSAATDNVTKDADNYDISVHYIGLSNDAIDQLDTLWRAKMADVMADMNTVARAMPASQNGSHRFRAGAYFYKEDTQ